MIRARAAPGYGGEFKPTDTVTKGPRVRLAEVVASLSLATDLAGGLPLEHGLRRCLLAVWLGEDLGLSCRRAQRRLLRRPPPRRSAAVSRGRSLRRSRGRTRGPRRQRRCRPGEYPGGAWVLRNFGADEPPLRRLHRGISRTFGADRVPDRVSRCRPAGRRDARHRAHDPPGPRPCHERWDGAGGPKRLKGEEIRLPGARLQRGAPSRSVQPTGRRRRRGRRAATWSWKVYEPRLADRFCRLAPRLLSRLESEPTWDAVLSAEPGSPRWRAR